MSLEPHAQTSPRSSIRRHDSCLTGDQVSEMIVAARLGGPEAVGELLERYSNYLRVLAITHLDARLRQRVSASDIVQETNCDAHRDFPKFRGSSEGEFVAWLRAILVHNLGRLIERHVLAEKRDVRREISLNQIRQSIERSTMRLQQFLADRGQSPSSHALQRERAVILADHLAALPENYRDVIVLRNLEGLAFSEVAERMGKSEGAVRMMWLRAIEALKARMVDECPLP